MNIFSKFNCIRKFKSMKKNEICQKLRPLVRKVIILDHKVVCSAGSGVVIREDGLVLTARHVIADEDGNQYTGQIMVSGISSGGLKPYIVVSPNLKFDMDIPELMSPINFDLAILRPLPPQEKIDHIKLSDDLIDIGDDIIMAGFPDDIDEPLHFMDNLNINNPDIVKMLIEYNNKFKFFFNQLLFKHGIIGNRQNIIFEDVHLDKLVGWIGPKTIKIEGAVYWTDNHLTYGGSGGPLVNNNCELVGIITEKAFTKLILEEPSNVEIPSGTGMALSHKLISWMLPHI